MNSFDFRLSIMLFGTALGAGVLFLPIKIGILGFGVFCVLFLLAWPLCYFSHLSLAKFCQKYEICDACQIYFGKKIGFLLVLLYFLAFFPATLLYGLGFVNTIAHFLEHELNFNEILGTKRLILSAFCAFILIFVMLFKSSLIIKICSFLTYPLIALLFIFSIYLIPYWKFDFILNFDFNMEYIIFGAISSLAILVFSFEHTPVISLLSSTLNKRYPKSQEEIKLKRILLTNSILLIFFIFFFTLSCILATPNMQNASVYNVSITSYLAKELNEPIIAYFGPAIAFLAIITSFFGHYFASKESLIKLINAKNSRKILFIDLVFFIFLVFVSYKNPSILTLIDLLAGPIITAILFILPLCGFYFVSSLKGYQNKFLDIFIFIFGVLAIFSAIFSFF